MSSSIGKEVFSGTILADKGVHKVQSKDIYDTPYQFSWLPLKPDVGQTIIGKLSLALRNYPRGRRTRGRQSTCTDDSEICDRTRGRKEARKRNSDVSGPLDANALVDGSSAVPESGDARSLDKVAVSDFDQIVLGLNAITRALENDLLRLVIVCQNVQPRRLIEHLPLLCRIRNVAFCLLPESSKSLAQLFSNSLDIKSLICMGFKRTVEKSCWDEMVDYIERQAPPLDIPWLQDVSFKNSPFGQKVSSEGRTGTTLHRDERHLTAEVGEVLAPVLQPLNIKRMTYVVGLSKAKRAKIKERK